MIFVIFFCKAFKGGEQNKATTVLPGPGARLGATPFGAAAGAPAQHATALFVEWFMSLCLSRACLGKMIVTRTVAEQMVSRFLTIARCLEPRVVEGPPATNANFEQFSI